VSALPTWTCATPSIATGGSPATATGTASFSPFTTRTSRGGQAKRETRSGRETPGSTVMEKSAAGSSDAAMATVFRFMSTSSFAPRDGDYAEWETSRKTDELELLVGFSS
jgi:hypothetical protein